MNTRFLLPLACAAGLAVAVPAHARDDAGRNMIIGGIAGAIIGEHNDHHAAEGAMIGAAAGLLFTAIADDGGCDRPREVYYNAGPSCPPRREVVVVGRPYCPPAPRVVVVHAAPHHSRNVVVVHPASRPAHRVVVVDSRHDRRETRYDNRNERRNDRREVRHERRDDRRDRHEDRRDRRDDRGEDRRDRREHRDDRGYASTR